MSWEFLRSEQGKDYLLAEYQAKERSTHDIARELKTFPNTVSRGLHHHGIPTRTTAAAQRIALAKGRADNPTAGRERTDDERANISEGTVRGLERLPPSERLRLRAMARQRWVAMSRPQKARILSNMGRGFRKAAVEGSKLEKGLFAGLVAAGYTAHLRSNVHTDTGPVAVDVHLPSLRVAIQVDGPTHHLPVFSEELLEDVQAADRVADERLVTAGLVVIRLTCLAKNVGERHKQQAVTLVAETLKRLRSDWPPPDRRVLALTVDP